MSCLVDIVSKTDEVVAELIRRETAYEGSTIRLIPSENYASDAVAAATGSIFHNKYSEGYPHQWKKGELIQENGRYYQGQEYTNALENTAKQRALQFFVPGKESDYHANVQPLSGAPANFAVLNAFLEPGDTLMGLSLDYGGHLTHGHKVNITAKYFKAVQYPLGSDCLLDYDLIRRMALESKPKVIICGATAYPRIIDFAKFGEIAREVGAILVADVAHISGIVATGVHPSPFPHADVMTTTTHKMLRGPRGALIVCKKEFGPQIDRSVFPAIQGGPHMATVAGIAVALKEALTPEYRDYTKQIVINARRLAERLNELGFTLFTGGTDNHLLLVDVTKGANGIEGKSGIWFAETLEKAGIVLNKNAVPGDLKPWNPSGIRLGTPAVTTLGMKEREMEQIADWIAAVGKSGGDQTAIAKIRQEVADLMKAFPIPCADL